MRGRRAGGEIQPPLNTKAAYFCCLLQMTIVQLFSFDDSIWSVELASK